MWGRENERAEREIGPNWGKIENGVKLLLYLDFPSKICFVCKFSIFYRNFEKNLNLGPILGDLVPILGPNWAKLGKNLKMVKNGCYIRILHPKITLSTYVEVSTFTLQF